MATIYHINDKGASGACSATKGGCPFGGAEEHYTSPAAAQAAYEERMSAATLPPPGGASEAPPLPKGFTPNREEALKAVAAGGVSHFMAMRVGKHQTPEHFYARGTKVAAGPYKWLMEQGYARKNTPSLRGTEVVLTAKGQQVQDREVAAVLADELRHEISFADEEMAHHMLATYRKHRFQEAFIEKVQEDTNQGITQHAAEAAYPQVQRMATVASVTAAAPWRRGPGEKPHKLLQTDEGVAVGTLQQREGFYILGARDAKTNKLISFPKNMFETEEEAAAAYRTWAYQHPRVATTV
jgi:hypothetical protein